MVFWKKVRAFEKQAYLQHFLSSKYHVQCAELFYIQCKKFISQFSQAGITIFKHNFFFFFFSLTFSLVFAAVMPKKEANLWLLLKSLYHTHTLVSDKPEPPNNFYNIFNKLAQEILFKTQNKKKLFVQQNYSQ